MFLLFEMDIDLEVMMSITKREVHSNQLRNSTSAENSLGI